jgi:cysteinyl-tRNA synthetase
MVEIRLRNSRSRSVETLRPLDPAQGVRMYLCGPTVYDRAHLGNARPSIMFDVLYRLLRHVSPGQGWAPPVYVRNFTDVDDRINETALARKKAGAEGTLEELIAERSEETIGWYRADMAALGCLSPDHEPRATGYIDEMIAMIQDLIADGHAYPAEGHVLFRVRSFAAYGALSGRSVDDMIAGARVEVAPFKEDPMDFVLWKPSSGDLPGWDSPWGRGRPGWHIECSAMSKALLGKTFDIHGGGNDLLFPHHENEIAQSCCANHTEQMAQIWLHNEMLLVEGRKMSKSLGNFFTVRDLLDQGVPGEVIRFVFLSTHYSKPMDWTEKKREDAEKTLRKWAQLFNDRPAARHVLGQPIDLETVSFLANDLNTHQALVRCEELFKAAREPNNDGNRALGVLYHTLRDLLGIDLEDAWEALRPRTLADEQERLELLAAYDGISLRHLSERLHKARFDALAKAQLSNADKKECFREVDALKSALTAAGVEVRMSKEGVELIPGPGFDPAKLEGLV